MNELSGYYDYDEQYIYINGESLAKAQLIGIVSNQTIVIRFMDKITSENVENFIKNYTPENKRVCLVFDHEHEYCSVVKNLEFINHQLCLFHLWEIIKRKIKKVIKRNSLNDEEIKVLLEYVGRIISIFLSDPKEDFIYMINRFFTKWKNIPDPLKAFYNKKNCEKYVQIKSTSI